MEAYSNKLEDLKYELTKALMREEKLDYRLAEVSANNNEQRGERMANSIATFV